MYAPYFTRKASPFYPFRESIGAHVSTVLGRRYDKRKQECQYLVRDSFGSNCEQYRLGDNVRECHEGYLWIPENVFMDMIASISYVVPK
jgi:hypothetical protein